VERIVDPIVLEPVDAAELPDGSLLIALKAGAIIHLDPATGSVREVFSMRDRVQVSTEQGMLAFALHPKFGSGGESRVYVTYINAADGKTHLDLLHLDPASLESLAPAETLLSITHFNISHNAADLEFISSGMLLLSTGDSGGSGDPKHSAQDTSSLLGKILEIDVEAQPIAVSNRAIGLRNPWKVVVEPASGALWITDVGQNCVEEVSRLTSEATVQPVNFGWPIMEGDHCFSALTCTLPSDYAGPKTSYTHLNGRCAVIGAAFALNHFLFTDYCTGELFALPLDAAERTEPTLVLWPKKQPHILPSALFSDRSGRVWVLEQLHSAIYQISIQR
jgi:glucose/arabinose dehydrogenase